jgi:Calcineurin-like phosphoesterase
MPQPERLLPLVRRAADCFRNTPGRRGHVVNLGDALDLCIAGDLHGHVDNFSRLLKVADLAQHPRRHLVVQEVIHGNFHYHDDSDKSHQMLDLIAALKCQFPARVHYLPGNHELAQYSNQLICKCEEDLNAEFRRGVDHAYKEHAPALYDAYVQLMMAAPLVVRTPNRVYLSHSLPMPSRLDSFDPAVLERDEFRREDITLGGTVYSLVWGKPAADEHVRAFLTKVDADWLINGHIPLDTGYEVSNSRQIILDAKGTPACYCLFPCDRPVSQKELVSMIGTL